MPDGLMTIGVFSRASSLSIKALRAYHEAGILEPLEVDPASGYRRYHAAQLTDAAVIVSLRQLDVPLDRVREVVRARDPEVTRRVLAAHTDAMRQRLDEVTRIVADLQAGVDHPADHTPVHVRDEAGGPTLAVRDVADWSGFPEFLRTAQAALAAAAARAGVAAAGPFGGLYPAEVVDDAAEPVEAYLPLAAPAPAAALTGGGEPGGPGGPGRRTVVAGQVPAARVAVLAHAGGYDTLPETYRRLGTWVAHHAEPAPGPVREVYVVGPADTAEPSRYRTEVHWPVRDAGFDRSVTKTQQ